MSNVPWSPHTMDDEQKPAPQSSFLLAASVAPGGTSPRLHLPSKAGSRSSHLWDRIPRGLPHAWFCSSYIHGQTVQKYSYLAIHCIHVIYIVV